ncbi:hypothetical protein EST38_g7295 [Candolleomyces aberdarensis]|uniref:Beta-glucuronidase C-terminal domain-containing protein n=1 Tax=Candolleomyces aberdarensis TaxID=2316362 RepID=A0A4Q2DHC9_9AGAR|nr:hypothetical protein EST38_g7295 [Candolleomyces aberdarensis]
MQNYLHNLIARIPSKPLRIRIGGNGMDGSTYVRKLKPVLRIQDPSAYFNDIPVDFGAGFFELLNGMADKVGAMQFAIGLSMRNIKGDLDESLKNVVDLAKDAKKMLGGRLDSLFLGNEPDLYTVNGKRSSYDINTYIPEVDQTVAALTKADVLTSGAPLLGGPTVCCSWSLLDVLNAGLEKHPYKYYTHENVEPYLNWNAPGMARAKSLGMPVVFSEYNSVACGGTNISATFAMALWSIDVGLKAASLGFSAAYIHTREFGIQYNLFDPPAADTSRSMESGWRTGTPYYATLFLAEVTSPEGNIVVDLNLHDPHQTPNANASATVAGYAIYSAKDRGRQKLVFINYSDSDSQPFRIGANTTYKVEYRTLTAQSARETKNVTWGGQTVGGYGNLVGTIMVLLS